MQTIIKNQIKAIKKVFRDPIFSILAAAIGFNFLALDYFIFSRTTTLEVFFLSNSPFYNWTSIVLSLLTAFLFGIALAMVIFILKRKLENTGTSTGSSIFGGTFGVIASGCPVCGAWLLPVLGIAGSLTAFPFQGLEIKIIAVFLLGFSIFQSSKSVLGICQPASKKRNFMFSLAFILVLISLIYALPKLPQEYKFNFSGQNIAKTALLSAQTGKSGGSDLDAASLISQINPEEGYTIKAKYENIGFNLLEAGVIDFEKFKSIYDRAGAPLTADQLKIFSQEGFNQEITIDSDNAYFLLNFFWALGLANKNPILEEGEITKYGESQIDSFASTGGWTIGTKPVMEVYSNSTIIKLNDEEQGKVEEVAGNAYRPCCGNSTAFPDCNHGMALLGVLELLAANDASLDQMYEAAKYFNAFWFPQQYFDLAVYFKVTDGLDFIDIDSKTIVGKDYSSGLGWSKTKRWLTDNNIIEKPPSGGGGCGV
ncbi:MAG: hypothetical protein Q8P63_01335 [Candidatus Nealsonbacteria bacterium]|nr:hypothetical protein [Candidatus Nealsonbacteria bacterium]